MSVENNLHELAMEHLRASNMAPTHIIAVVRQMVESGTIRGDRVWDCLDGLSVDRPPDCYDDGYGTHANCGLVIVIPDSQGANDE